MKTLFFITLVSLFSPAIHATSELDRGFIKPNLAAARTKLPKTLVMRVGPDGKVAVAHLNRELPPKPNANVGHLKYASVDPERVYRKSEFPELDNDNSRESWYYWYSSYTYAPPAYRPYYPYYPIYYFDGYPYTYTPYYSYNYGGYYYYFYSWA